MAAAAPSRRLIAGARTLSVSHGDAGLVVRAAPKTLAAPRPVLLGRSSALSCPASSLPARPRAIHTSPPRWARRYDRFPGSSGGGWEPAPPSRGSPGSGPGSGPKDPREGGRFGNSPVVMLLRRRLGGDRGLVLFAVGGGGALVYYLAHLERVPETGRWRFIDVSPASESAIALQTVQETLSQYQGQLLPASSPITRQVRRVAKRIVEGNGLGTMKEGHGGVGGVGRDQGGWVDLKGLGEVMMGGGGGGGPGEGEMQWGAGEQGAEGKNVEWEVYVIKDDKTKNAFVLPGGKIFVFTGILPVCKNDDGLASVLGHEVAHQVARHSAERLSSAKVLFALGYALELLGLDVGISRILLTFLLQLPNSRKAESEADYIGVRLMSKACFDPRESTRMWTRMSESEKGGSLGGTASIDFLSTHPANQKRIKALEKWMPEALDVRAASPCGDTSSQYEMFREHLPKGQSERVWA